MTDDSRSNVEQHLEERGSFRTVQIAAGEASGSIRNHALARLVVEEQGRGDPAKWSPEYRKKLHSLMNVVTFRKPIRAQRQYLLPVNEPKPTSSVEETASRKQRPSRMSSSARLTPEALVRRLIGSRLVI
jgi:hypothetical protein